MASSENNIEAGQGGAGDFERVPPTAPRQSLGGLFFFGTFGFPFRTDALGKLIAMTVGAVLMTWVVKMALGLGSIESGGFTGAGIAIGSMLMSMLGGCFALAWIIAASACGLTILRETSYNVSSIEHWPNLLSQEGLGEVVYLLSALLLGAVPGAAAVPLCGMPGLLGVFVT